MNMKSIILACGMWAAATAACAQYAPAGDRIKTPWGEKIDVDQVWNEYPRPIMKRTDWSNLNGLWSYAIEPKNTAMPRQYEGEILVPFAVESSLSGVGRRLGEEEALWYKRDFTVPSKWRGQHVLLHFGAVDWQADVWVNDVKVGMHKGGYTPFSFDITAALKKSGSNTLVVRVYDTTDAGYQPRGKQVSRPEAIWYTPVSGIWQTVWLEPVAETHIENLRILPDIDRNILSVGVETSASAASVMAEVVVLDGDTEVARSRSVNG